MRKTTLAIAFVLRSRRPAGPEMTFNTATTVDSITNSSVPGFGFSRLGAARE
ncbi:MAG TPA: hypothetical protein VE974_15360 [Thermoanaerobaculia bacterium]|nr:hypothetical protein [Thermoanaerobaculia bacterium]